MITSEKDQAVLAMFSSDQLEGVMVLTARRVGDGNICKALGISPAQLTLLSATDWFKARAAQGNSEVLLNELSIDQKWDAVEDQSLNIIIENIQSSGQMMETSQLLMLGKMANAARRRHGVLDNSKGGTINGSATGPNGQVNNGTIINITVPEVLAKRFKEITEENRSIFSNVGNSVPSIHSMRELETKYTEFTTNGVTPDLVTEILGVDLKSSAIHGGTLPDDFTQMYAADSTVSSREG